MNLSANINGFGYVLFQEIRQIRVQALVRATPWEHLVRNARLTQWSVSSLLSLGRGFKSHWSIYK